MNAAHATALERANAHLTQALVNHASARLGPDALADGARSAAKAAAWAHERAPLTAWACAEGGAIPEPGYSIAGAIAKSVRAALSRSIESKLGDDRPRAVSLMRSLGERGEAPSRALAALAQAAAEARAGGARNLDRAEQLRDQIAKIERAHAGQAGIACDIKRLATLAAMPDSVLDASLGATGWAMNETRVWVLRAAIVEAPATALGEGPDAVIEALARAQARALERNPPDPGEVGEAARRWEHSDITPPLLALGRAPANGPTDARDAGACAAQALHTLGHRAVASAVRNARAQASRAIRRFATAALAQWWDTDERHAIAINRAIAGALRAETGASAPTPCLLESNHCVHPEYHGLERRAALVGPGLEWRARADTASRIAGAGGAVLTRHQMHTTHAQRRSTDPRDTCAGTGVLNTTAVRCGLGASTYVYARARRAGETPDATEHALADVLARAEREAAPRR